MYDNKNNNEQNESKDEEDDDNNNFAQVYDDDSPAVDDEEGYQEGYEDKEGYDETKAAAADDRSTFWSDEEGNLKFVNVVVRCPCCIFGSLLAACIVITFLLIIALIAQGNPFTEPENESDLDHITSIMFDSLRLAQEDVEDLRDSRQGAMTIRRQSETQDYAYWVFEAETPQGCFGSRTSIANMKEAFDLFMDHEEYNQYCLLKYDINNETSVTGSLLLLNSEKESDYLF
mmetsp:Transcript_128063/g.190830  ORF Transcript_128063/g.190830 Transcript_128063/m.190830 type:complete len:231 (-) Transcript_128063:35-727(-)|eukprot:CAMPEP_0117027916 /NCGR_PEP_ID=MMETSP0472-20121206/20349_1 /TAXON_ID=693140 ORGANISM="Tiarina fusus, Strain LIS" /NCGR_SAMPLE_ID=MMETSP0472 /ASSEMBLY_ACC=CAM_ASM_000603 /LENGTH=230 /DNA_ID=CAMNT_0004735269 /DNA_START=262 /DNA_END=954 /DNA_ORIENTATION=+